VTVSASHSLSGSAQLTTYMGIRMVGAVVARRSHSHGYMDVVGRSPFGLFATSYNEHSDFCLWTVARYGWGKDVENSQSTIGRPVFYGAEVLASTSSVCAERANGSDLDLVTHTRLLVRGWRRAWRQRREEVLRRVLRRMA